MAAKLLNSYASSSGYLAQSVKNFLVDEVGWGLVETISDTAYYKDYVLSSLYSNTTSSGTDIDSVFCVRLSASGTELNVYGYDDCCVTVSGTTYSGEIYNSGVSAVYCPNNEFQYWAIADSDCLKLVLKSEDHTEYYHGYVGAIDTVYNAEDDPMPLLVFATSSGSSDWDDGVSALMMTVSGEALPYSVWMTYSAEYGDSYRIQRCGGIRPLLYLKSPISQQEVRGFPKGVYKIPDGFGGSGIQYTVGSGTYYAFSIIGTNQGSYMYGPVYL